MSLLQNILSLASTALRGNPKAIGQKVEAAIKQGIKPESPVAQEIVQMVLRQFPALRGKANVVQAIDDLIPDSLQTKFGFTPQVMQFMKQALGSAPKPPTVQ